MRKTIPVIALSFLLTLFSLHHAMAFGNSAHLEMHQQNAKELSQDQKLTFRIPVFSEEFAGTPVASVNGHPVLLGELTPELKVVDEEMPLANSSAAKALSNTFKKLLDQKVAQRSAGKSETQTEIYTDATITQDRLLTLQVPLFSAWFSDMPVAEVDQEPIRLGAFAQDFESAYKEMSGENPNATPEKIGQSLLQRLVTIRLVEFEARNIGLDQTDSIKKQVDAYAEKTLLYALLSKQLEGKKVDEKEADKLYKQISLQGKFDTYRFTKEEDAIALLKAVEKGEKFKPLIDQAIQKGQAVKEDQPGFIKFKDLISQVATAASEMKIGEISKIYRKADGYVIFQLKDRQFIEDPSALQFARKSVWDGQVAKIGAKYITDLVNSTVTFDKKAQEDLDFQKIGKKNPNIKLSEALAPFLKDQRVLATVKGAEPGTLTVAELANKLKGTFYHGTDIVLEPKEVNTKKEQILTDALFRMSGKVVAVAQKLDQTSDYQMKVAEFERKTLFDNFMQKVIVPDIKLTEDDIQKYYEEHKDQYSTPMMIKVKSLPFYKEKDAQNALKKLQSGSDFKWVSSNTEGRVNVENKDLLTFDNNILSITSLPEDIQAKAKGYKTGDAIIYPDPDKFFYVLYFEQVYPAEPKPYDQVRSEIRQLVFQNKVEESLDQWVSRLKEAYKAQVFLVDGQS